MSCRKNVIESPQPAIRYAGYRAKSVGLVIRECDVLPEECYRIAAAGNPLRRVSR
jgi:hypothetical protein